MSEGRSETVTANRIGYHIALWIGIGAQVLGMWACYSGQYPRATLLDVTALTCWFIAGRFQDADRWNALYDYLRAQAAVIDAIAGAVETDE